jgi:GTP-binding protein
MADVALVGFPNVGKSTLISVISAAKPKIADYPFTTLEPNLGVVRLDGASRGSPRASEPGSTATEFVVADIPGLIEGASEGRGLGHQFLRHVERARVLCLLVDLAALDGTTPAEQERILLAELGAYRPDLLERPRLVVGTKADITGTIDHDELGFTPDGETRFVISAVTRDGLGPLVGAMARHVHGARQEEPVQDGVVLLRPVPSGAAVEREGEHEFRVRGRDVERVVALNDVTSPDAVAYIGHRLERLGVNKLLARAGAADGDVVWIGDFSFEYRE